MSGVNDPAGYCGEIQPDLDRAKTRDTMLAAAELANQALDADAADETDRALCLWRQVFGPAFPEPHRVAPGHEERPPAVQLRSEGRLRPQLPHPPGRGASVTFPRGEHVAIDDISGKGPVTLDSLAAKARTWWSDEPALLHREQDAMTRTAPDLIWSDQGAGAWTGLVPAWPFDRAVPPGLEAFMAGRRLRAQVSYGHAFPMAPPRSTGLPSRSAAHGRTPWSSHSR